MSKLNECRVFSREEVAAANASDMGLQAENAASRAYYELTGAEGSLHEKGVAFGHALVALREILKPHKSWMQEVTRLGFKYSKVAYWINVVEGKSNNRHLTYELDDQLCVTQNATTSDSKSANAPRATLVRQGSEETASENIPGTARVFKPLPAKPKKTDKLPGRGKNPSPTGKIKGAVSVPFNLSPRVVAASDGDPRKADKSDEARTAIECVFILTHTEKLTFMDGIKLLGELRAVHVMYQAVASAAQELARTKGEAA